MKTMISNGAFGSKKVIDFQISDFVTKTPILNWDYANVSTISQEASRTYARANGNNALSWDSERGNRVTVETQMFTLAHLALLTGSKIENDVAAEIGVTERLKVEDAGDGDLVVNLSNEPVGDVRVSLVYGEDYGDLGDPVEVEEVTASIVTLASNADVTEGTSVEVFYRVEKENTRRLRIRSDQFPKYVHMLGLTVLENEDGTVTGAQLEIFRAKADPNFELTFATDGDPATLSIDFDVFPVRVDGCMTAMDIVLFEGELDACSQ